MTPKRSLEEIEGLLQGFAPIEPNAQVGERIAHAAARARQQGGRRRAVLAGLAGATAAAAIVFFAVMRDRPESPAPAAAGGASIAAAPEEVTLAVLVSLRTELDEIKEMRDIIPAQRDKEREQISTKLEACLERLTRLEREVLLKEERSYNPGTRRKEVHV
jgi:hypothetical protein